MSLVILFFGAAIFWRAIKQHRRIRQIEDTPSSKAATAAQGLVELQGFTWPAGATQLIRNKKEVVYYSCEVQYARPLLLFYGQSSRWKTVAKRVHSLPFYLVDETGVVKIDPTHAETHLHQREVKYWKDASPELKNDLLGKEFKPPIRFLSHFMGIIRRVIRTALLSPAFFLTIFVYIYDRMFFSLIPHYPPSPSDKSYRVVESWIEVGSPMYASGDLTTRRAEITSIEQVGLAAFAESITKSSFRQAGEVAKATGFAKLETDFVSIAKELRADATQAPQTQLKVHGQMATNGIHTLFLGDGMESELKKQLGAWLQLRFVAGAAVVTLGASLFGFNIHSTHQKFAGKASSSSKRAPAAARVDLGRLHALCVEGELSVCTDLVKNKVEYRLPEKNYQYYKHRQSTLQSPPTPQ